MTETANTVRPLHPLALTQRAVLATLRKESLHGYGIMQALGKAAGTVYPVLRQLMEHGWIVEEPTPADKRHYKGVRVPRIYSITEAGKQALRSAEREHRR